MERAAAIPGWPVVVDGSGRSVEVDAVAAAVGSVVDGVAMLWKRYGRSEVDCRVL